MELHLIVKKNKKKNELVNKRACNGNIFSPCIYSLLVFCFSLSNIIRCTLSLPSLLESYILLGRHRLYSLGGNWMLCLRCVQVYRLAQTSVVRTHSRVPFSTSVWRDRIFTDRSSQNDLPSPWLFAVWMRWCSVSGLHLTCGGKYRPHTSVFILSDYCALAMSVLLMGDSHGCSSYRNP